MMKHWSGWWGVVACALVAGIAAFPAPASAWQAVAKVTTSSGTVIEGDSVLKGYEKQIVILGLGSSAQRPGTSFSVLSGAVVAKLKAAPLQLVKVFDIATPALVGNLGSGTGISRVEITIFKSTTTGIAPGFKITLSPAFLISMETTYDPGATPSALEKLEFAFRTLVWTDLTTGRTGTIEQEL
jgi:type VI secretion system Hcp family effector